MKSATTRFHAVRRATRRFDLSRPYARLACRLLSAWLRFRRWRAAQRAIRHLREIDDYLLDDVGIQRREIAAAVRGSARFAHTANPQPGRPARAYPGDKLAA